MALAVSLLNDGLCDLASIEGSISADDAFTAVTWATAPFGGAPVGRPAPTPWTRFFSRCRPQHRTGT